MIAAEALVPLPVVGPLVVAAVLLTIGRLLPSRLPDVAAVATALAVAGLCAALSFFARENPLVYWFDGWMPRPDVVLGVGFGVDPASAIVASFVGFLFAAALVFAWGYFDEAHVLFQVLMLLFLAAMEGFCLTRDLFNTFVWFEVMSVAAFALTAYQLEAPSLAGALNFTVTNSLANCAMLGGVGWPAPKVRITPESRSLPLNTINHLRRRSAQIFGRSTAVHERLAEGSSKPAL